MTRNLLKTKRHVIMGCTQRWTFEWLEKGCNEFALQQSRGAVVAVIV